MWMIYGANGYTGRLIAFEAKRRGHSPFLAGRNHQAIKNVAGSLSMPYQYFDLEDPVDRLAERLKGLKLVLNCAGPFTYTTPILTEACLKAGVSYLDITGEIEVFEYIFQMDEKARQAGIVMIPGVGFDVVPSDALSLFLKEKHPEADRLEIFIRSEGGVSPGTLKTALEYMGKPGFVRRKSILSRESVYKSKKVSRGQRAVYIPWGDLSAAYRSTRIPDIEVFLILPVWLAQVFKNLNWLQTPLGDKDLQDKVRYLVNKFYSGPLIGKLKKTRGRIWARVYKGDQLLGERGIETPNPYELTADAALICVEKVLQGELRPGAYTPAQAFGARLLDEIRDVKEIPNLKILG